MTSDHERIRDYVAFALEAIGQHWEERAPFVGRDMYPALVSRFGDTPAFRASFVEAVKAALPCRDADGNAVNAAMEVVAGANPDYPYGDMGALVTSSGPLAQAIVRAASEAAPGIPEADLWKALAEVPFTDVLNASALHFLSGLHDSPEDILAAAAELQDQSDGNPLRFDDVDDRLLRLDLSPDMPLDHVAVAPGDFVRACLAARGIEPGAHPGP